MRTIKKIHKFHLSIEIETKKKKNSDILIFFYNIIPGQNLEKICIKVTPI